MGELALPLSGKIYLDANCFIYSVEKIAPYEALLKPVWTLARAGKFQIQSSELALLEVLIKPLKNHDAILEESFRSLLLNSAEVEVIPITRNVLERAANVRAHSNLKAPDAIHAATALLNDCTLFITNDGAFRRIPNLQVAVLNELV